MKSIAITTDITNPQDSRVYLAQNIIFNAKEQKKLAANYLYHYFSPWHQKNLYENMQEVKADCNSSIEKLTQEPGYGTNLQPHTKEWINAIRKNANIQNHFTNIMLPAISTSTIDSHLAPTLEPNYPIAPSANKIISFDHNQQSLIYANTPFFVVHVSRDGAWYYIVTSSFTAWVAKKDVAFVDHKFMTKWQTQKYITPLQDNITIFDRQNNCLNKTRIGEIYPLYKATANYYYVYIAAMDANQHAVIKVGRIAKKVASYFPKKLTSNNIAHLANAMLGDPYGWGGLFGYRDCSSTMLDLFTPFGIWLARNSGDQIKASDLINLAKLDAAAKVKLIKTKGIPFVTLLHLPGHIMLYLGEYRGELYVYHNTWGEMHFRKGYKEETNIIGRTVITPVSLLREKNATVLDQIDGMRILVPTIR